MGGDGRWWCLGGVPAASSGSSQRSVSPLGAVPVLSISATRSIMLRSSRRLPGQA
ncbi:hypothetical protein M5585_22835 [Serratia ureilytica]